MNKKFCIAIIGSGAAGIMAAITAARNNKSVILIEKNNILGRKILATGNGRCNLTNLKASVEHYHGGNPEFIKKVLGHFDQHKTISFFEQLGLVIKEEDNGRIFPRTNQASSVVNLLELELRRLKVDIRLATNIKNINKDANWKLLTDTGETIEAEKLVLATGGLASQQFGSSGDGIYWSKKLGLEVSDQFPALVPLETVENWPKTIQGLKIWAKVDVVKNGEQMSTKTGDLLFTHYGLSGPTILGQTRYISPFISHDEIKVNIDAYPEGTQETLISKINQIFESNGAKSVKNALSGLLPLNLARVILEILKIDPNRKAAQLPKEDRKSIAKSIKQLTLTVKNVRSFKEAQVTIGGIKTDQLTDKLEAKKIKNLYFCGEIIDVDGYSGGFNLQWAWSSGHLVGSSV